MPYELRNRPRSPLSLCGSVVEHRRAESEDLRFDFSWGLRIFSLSHVCDKMKNIFLYFVTELTISVILFILPRLIFYFLTSLLDIVSTLRWEIAPWSFLRGVERVKEILWKTLLLNGYGAGFRWLLLIGTGVGVVWGGGVGGGRWGRWGVLRIRESL